MQELSVVFPTSVRRQELLGCLASIEIKMLSTPLTLYSHGAFESIDFYGDVITINGSYLMKQIIPEMEEQEYKFEEEEFDEWLPFNEYEDYMPMEFTYTLSRNHISSFLAMFDAITSLFRISVCENGFMRHEFNFFLESEFDAVKDMLHIWKYDMVGFYKTYVKN